MADRRTAAEREEAAAARTWAAANGLSVAPTGRLPKGVLASFRAARDTGPEPGDGDPPDLGGPDWEAAAAELLGGPGADLLDDAGPEPGPDDGGGQDQAAAAAGVPEHPAAPPPASLEEARERLGGGRRARPVWSARPARQAKDRPPPPAPVKVTKAVVDDVTGKLALLLAIPAATWQTVDPPCGGAFADNLDNIIAKAVPLICLSPEAIRWLTKSGKFMLLLAFVQACQPVAVTAYQHHVTKTIAVLADGRIVYGQLQHDGTVRWPDAAAAAAAPPAPDYSAYHTQATGHVPPVYAAR